MTIKLAQHLTKANVPKNSALIIAHIIEHGDSKAVQIERATDLRQPEVSIATNWLREKGWLTKTDSKPKGNGRPTHVYSLKKSAQEIYKEVEKEEMKMVKEIEGNLKELKKNLK